MIAIYFKKGHFSERWLEYCIKQKIPYKLVNPYSSDIVSQLVGCSYFMWHFDHMEYKDSLFAKQLIQSIELKGIIVFPNFFTCWHFNDKVGQKYLLESINAPLVPTQIFYDKKSALNWTESTSFPKVFKLRGGSGSLNVKIIKDKATAKKLIKQAFRRGFPLFNNFTVFNERLRKYRLGKASGQSVVKWFLAIFLGPIITQQYGRERGYFYCQEFIPNNSFDIRVVVIGPRAFAIKRMVRRNDFRASGSGFIVYDKNQIDIKCVQISFDMHSKLKAQVLAYDFVFDSQNNPLIVEISFGYNMEAYDLCEGYWDKNLEWYEGYYKHEYWIVDLLLGNLK
ncbi:MAG TPA: hypothetical protein PLQ82_05100 [Desulfobacteraceae bacterium]|nr:hypothetical protein [Desulfobacteraceae bacterium]HPQ27833.1 hypothetical protein [Desulfobacteraceae bacterium]